jgi:hypothetical protein
MADEIKLPVSAPGAKEAAADLKAVAGATGQVAQATQAAAPATQAAAPATQAAAAADTRRASASKAAGEAAKSQNEQNRTLVESLRRLGPEASMAADIIQSLALKHGTAAISIGLVGAAIGIGIELFQRYAESQAKAKEQADAATRALAGQAEAYAKLAEEMDKARRSGAVENVTATRLALDIGGQLGLSRQQTEDLAKRIVSRELSPEAALAAGERMARQSPGDSPEAQRARAVGRAELAAGVSEQGQAVDILASVTKREAIRRGIDPSALKVSDTARWLTERAATMGKGGADGERAANELAAFFSEYPELGGYVRDERGGERGITVSASGQVLNTGWSSSPNQTGTQVSLNAVAEYLAKQGMIVQGGNHYHGTVYQGQTVDSAGVVSPSEAR